MRDKLIELISQMQDCGEKETDFTTHIRTNERLADYLIANGVIVPPCKIGDTVYYPAFGIDRVLLYKVISIKLNSKGLYVVCENRLSKSQMTHRAIQIGKTIFLTKEEAERALAEKRKRNEIT